MRSFDYYSPPSLQEAFSLLSRFGEQARALAGGTDLIVQMKAGKTRPSAIIDVKNLAELKRLEWITPDTLFIGAAVPLSQIIAWPELKSRFGLLYDACSMMGSFQLRNRGTVGGNICNAAPSADSVPPLLCLDARAIIASLKGEHSVPLESFFVGPGKTILTANELLIGIEVSVPSGRVLGAYLRHTPRVDMDIAVASAAALLLIEETGGVCREARIALGAVAPTPIRVYLAENVLKGKAITEQSIIDAAEKAAEVAKPITDLRGSTEYRRELVKVLTTRALKKAMGVI